MEPSAESIRCVVDAFERYGEETIADRLADALRWYAGATQGCSELQAYDRAVAALAAYDDPPPITSSYVEGPA